MLRKTEKKCDSKNFFEKHSACIVCSEKDKKMRFKGKIEKHNAGIVCSEKMAMECRQVSTLEHEGEQ
jgi:hypothetical protein